MKNLLRARIAQLAGIIAVVAVIGLFMTACGEDPAPAEPPAGYVTLRASSFGLYVGETLTAEYDGDEEVFYGFFKDTGTVKDDLEAGRFDVVDDADIVREINNTATWTPDAAGDYFAAAVEKGVYTTYKAAIDSGSTAAVPTFTCSSSVNILARPAYAEFWGTWLMDGHTNNWKPDSQAPNTPSFTETLTITNGQFKLDSSYKPTASNPQSQFEHVYCTINSWEEITGADLTVSTTGIPVNLGGPNTTDSPVTYAKGWKLNVTKTDDFGYGWNYDTSGFKIYMLQPDPSKPAQIGIRKDSGPGNSNGVVTVIGRIYIKQQ